MRSQLFAARWPTVAVLLLAAAGVGLSSTAHAVASKRDVWDAPTVQSLASDVKAGRSLRHFASYPDAETQILQVTIGTDIAYLIDLRAQLCFARINAPAAVPCAALKKGYPLLAPLITWVD